MKLTKNNTLAMAVSAALCAPSVYAEDAGSISEALSSGSFKLHLRPRIEHVEQDGVENATAHTLKTRMTYESGKYNGFSLMVEMDDTTEVIDSNYNTIIGPDYGTAVIADPEVTEVNQAYLGYQVGATTLKFGRQRIILDNQRFVGGVGWRQDEQTYDGFSVSSNPIEGLSLFGAYIGRANRILAEEQDHNHETYLLNAGYETPFGKIIGYGYLIDNKTAWALSSDTMGVRWQGKAGSMVTYNLEYATQSEAGDNPVEYTADYMLAEVNIAIPIGDFKLNIKPGYEVLGSDPDATNIATGESSPTAFKTPLATLHAFQGWTDKFLGTPADGIEDTYLWVGGMVAGYKLGVVYHSFAASEGDAEYGSETGIVIGKSFGPVGLTLKAADYSADEWQSDTSKVWLQAAMTF